MTSLRLAAGVNVGTHVAALALAATVMRKGTPLDGWSRVPWLADRPLGWTVGWILWMICAIALVAFVALAVRQSDASPRVARLVVLLAVIGAAIDLVCNATWIVLVPDLAAHDLSAFLMVERLLGALGQIGANGLYSVAVLVCALSFRRAVVRWLGIGTFVAGMVMVVAGITADAGLLAASTGPTIGLFCAWTIAIAVWEA